MVRYFSVIRVDIDIEGRGRFLSVDDRLQIKKPLTVVAGLFG